MRLTKSFAAVAAVAAATVLTLSQAAFALAPPAKVYVGGSGANASYPITGIARMPLSVTIGSAIPLTLDCTSGAPTGVVNGGTTGVPSNALFKFTDLGLVCDNIMGSGTANMSVRPNCITFTVDASEQVTDYASTSTRDSRIDGVLNLTNAAGVHCIVVDEVGCDLEIGASTPAYFDERLVSMSGVNYQPFTVTGNGLRTKNVVGCFGLVSNNNSVTLNATFDLNAAQGAVDVSDVP